MQEPVDLEQFRDLNVLATGPVLSYDVPQPVEMNGRFVIELRLPASDFIASARGLTAKEGQS